MAVRRDQPILMRLDGFGALWGSSAISNLADGLFQVALPLLAAFLTRSPGMVAAVTFALSLPWLLLALPVGALVDRWDRRRAMVVANALRAAVLGLLTLAATLDAVNLPLLYGAALLLGTAEVLADTASQAILPSIVPADRLEGANARLLSTQTITNTFAGPPLAGLLAGVAIALAIGVSGGLYAVAAAALVPLAGTFRPARQPDRRLWAEITDGLRFLWGHRLLRILAVIVFVMNIGWAGWLAIMVLYAVAPGPMGLTPFGYGLLFTTMGVGGVVGTVITAPALRLLGRRWAIGVDILGTVVMLATPALTTNAWMVGAAAFVGGAGATMWGVVVTSIRQQAVPDALLGRVSSAFRLFSLGAGTVGAALAGALAQLAGLRAVFATSAALAILLLVPFFAEITNEALESARQPAPPR
jgi:MFS family permease